AAEHSWSICHGPEPLTGRPECGRLGVKLEGAVKVRISAIPTHFAQAFVRPVHDWAIGVLSHLRTDGTFHQTRPLRYICGIRNGFSYDSATDSLPVVLTPGLLEAL
ncbi:hypothetical protein EXY23_27530, partial [Roseicella aquatilis]